MTEHPVKIWNNTSVYYFVLGFFVSSTHCTIVSWLEFLTDVISLITLYWKVPIETVVPMKSKAMLLII